jgi:hypothetical protein
MKERVLTKREVLAYSRLREERLFLQFCDDCLDTNDPTGYVYQHCLLHTYRQYREMHTAVEPFYLRMYITQLRRWYGKHHPGNPPDRYYPDGTGEVRIKGIRWKTGKYLVVANDDYSVLTKMRD